MQGLLGLGGPRLTELAKAVGLRGVHPSPGARAAALRDGLAEPGLLRLHLLARDYDAMGARLRVGSRSGLGAAFEDAVFARLFAVGEEKPENRAVRSLRDTSRAAEWPELAGLEVWRGLGEERRRAVAAELAGRLGGEALEASADGLARVRDGAMWRVWIAVPGGAFAMGLRKEEEAELRRMSREWGTEGRMHVLEMAKLARPVHAVRVAAFLCAAEPDGQMDGTAAIAHAKAVGGRLLSEAEWEYLARGEFGVDGGTWVEDGWHSNYEGAPEDGAAWEPRERPEMVRGGGWLSWPWQVEGEQLLLHPANRERKGEGTFPLLVARDLPGR